MKTRLWKEFMGLRFYAVGLAMLWPIGTMVVGNFLTFNYTTRAALAISMLLFNLIAVSAFGAEFGSGTLGWLLAQPVSRNRIWVEKFGIAAAAILVGAALNAWAFGGWFTNVDRATGITYVNAGGTFYRATTACVGALALASGPLAAIVCRDAFKGFLCAVIMPAALALVAQVALALVMPADASVAMFEFWHERLGAAAPLILLTAVWAPLGTWLGWIAFKRLEV